MQMETFHMKMPSKNLLYLKDFTLSHKKVWNPSHVI